MPESTILVVDPDQLVLSSLRRSLLAAGHLFCGARRGADALRKARMVRPDAIVLRTVLPDMFGREVVGQLREEAEAVHGRLRTPVLVTARRGEEELAASCLELGAMSVLFFPFDEKDLVARLADLVEWARRPREERVLKVGPLSMDLETGKLIRPAGEKLTDSELAVLRCLLSPPGRAVTRRQIPVETERAVDVHVASLRSKLGAAGKCIETIRGIGYRFRSAACL
jgi:two-component system phosphate regulon response regulator PhoB